MISMYPLTQYLFTGGIPEEKCVNNVIYLKGYVTYMRLNNLTFIPALQITFLKVAEPIPYLVYPRMMEHWYC